MKELDEVEKKIKRILQQVIDDANSRTESGTNKDKWWTKKIKDALCQLGHEMKCAVNANGCDCADDKREWLFDMVWAYPKDDWKELILTMESEWSRDEDEIWWDFEKLLVVRSKYRIFIFQANETEIKNLMEKFWDKIKKVKTSLSGDRYFLAGYSTTGHEFIFKNFVVP